MSDLENRTSAKDRKKVQNLFLTMFECRRKQMEIKKKSWRALRVSAPLRPQRFKDDASVIGQRKLAESFGQAHQVPAQNPYPKGSAEAWCAFVSASTRKAILSFFLLAITCYYDVRTQILQCDR